MFSAKAAPSLSTLSPVSADSLGLTVLGREDWRSSLAAAVDAPPGADPLVADALARGRKGRADALLIESRGGASLLPVVRHHRRVGDVVEALPHGIAGGPVTIFGEPPPAQAAAVRRVLGAQRASVAVHHMHASGHPRGLTTTHVLELVPGRPRPRERARRKLRNAARAGVEVRRGGPRDVPSLLRILDAAVDARGGMRYTDDQIVPVATCERAFVLVASLDDRDISAALFLHSPLELFYWLGGTLPGHEHSSPSYAVIDAAIAFAVDRDCRFVNLGSSDGLDGVAFFKEGFGARRVSSPLLVAETRRFRTVSALRNRVLSTRFARRTPPAST
jgi:hypothetical protein